MKIEYETEIEMLFINNEKCKLKIDMPNIIVVLDPFCIYFCFLYFCTPKGQNQKREKQNKTISVFFFSFFLSNVVSIHVYI